MLEPGDEAMLEDDSADRKEEPSAGKELAEDVMECWSLESVVTGVS